MPTTALCTRLRWPTLHSRSDFRYYTAGIAKRWATQKLARFRRIICVEECSVHDFIKTSNFWIFFGRIFFNLDLLNNLQPEFPKMLDILKSKMTNISFIGLLISVKNWRNYSSIFSIFFSFDFVINFDSLFFDQQCGEAGSIRHLPENFGYLSTRDVIQKTSDEDWPAERQLSVPPYYPYCQIALAGIKLMFVFESPRQMFRKFSEYLNSPTNILEIFSIFEFTDKCSENFQNIWIPRQTVGKFSEYLISPTNVQKIFRTFLYTINLYYVNIEMWGPFWPTQCGK